jgi:hypothetical protein
MDRLGQIAGRMATEGPGHGRNSADALIDLRVGRDIIQAREALSGVGDYAARQVAVALREVAELYKARNCKRDVLATNSPLLGALDLAIVATRGQQSHNGDAMLLALVGLRCNLDRNSRVDGSMLP